MPSTKPIREAMAAELAEQRFEASPRGKFIRRLKDQRKAVQEKLDSLLIEEELMSCITSLEGGTEALRYLENTHAVSKASNIDSKMYVAQRHIEHLDLAIEVMEAEA